LYTLQWFSGYFIGSDRQLPEENVGQAPFLFSTLTSQRMVASNDTRLTGTLYSTLSICDYQLAADCTLNCSTEQEQSSGVLKHTGKESIKRWRRAKEEDAGGAQSRFNSLRPLRVFLCVLRRLHVRSFRPLNSNLL
jgi:hypothetical protein